MKTIAVSTVIGACLLGMVGSFATYVPGHELAVRLQLIAVGAAFGLVYGVVSRLVTRRSRGRPK